MATTTASPQQVSTGGSNNEGSWGLHMFLGVLLVIAAFIVWGAAAFTSTLSVLLLGWILLIGGIVEFFSIFFSNQNRLGNALLGILNTIVGFLIITNPEVSLATITLLFAMLLTVGGLTQMLSGAFSDMNNKGWSVFGGLVTFILGVMIWANWPESSLTTFGIFIGIYFFLAGISWFVESFEMRRLSKA